VLFGLPFIRVKGHPLFMFHILKGKFILFGQVFWPQDFYLFGLGMLTFVLFIVLFTVVFGRIFCGWACPQTVFMEMVFRKVEYFFEGDASAQRQLDKSPWNAEKIRKKAGKHITFFLMAFIIANTFLSYLIGTDELFQIMREPVSEHLGGFMSIVLFSGAFYGVYARFREQVCIVVCPYGRLQGVLLDKASVVVAYDYVRGEPRHKFKKNESRSEGDCIDCKACVRVCPTGIDIRNGTQLECVNCTACIDACDHIMDSVGLPKGLIRYDSEQGIKEGKKLRVTPRMMAYSAVLLVLLTVEVALLATRSDIDTTVIRARGLLYMEEGQDKIKNLYNIKLTNKTYEELPVTLKLESMNGEVKIVGKDLVVPKEGRASGGFFVILDKKDVKDRKTKIKLGLYHGTEKIRTIETSFLGPFSNNKKS
jgi:cytochrome c oxidase accessory protein FixG